ncbi:MAG: aldehyde dehydrogenase family protein [Rhizobiaceae bacterium]|nr:aldehyde dehydrogenase family protein [Rhizobiaceae bacterium]
MDTIDHLGSAYIDGAFRPLAARARRPVINPSSEEIVAEVALAESADVNVAVQAAKKAFRSFGVSSKADRIALLRRILAEYRKRADEFAYRMTIEMGTPITFSREVQTPLAARHIEEIILALQSQPEEAMNRTTVIRREPIGVAALITPWNWPMLQIVTKLAPAIAAGCTVVLKPSEFSPLSALLFAEVMHAAGTPPGVFNMLNGDGLITGAALSVHPDVDMVSFTGSTRAGIQIAKGAADTVKRVHQELGGKSPNIILPDADLETAVTKGVAGCYLNNGQSCSAPTRMLVPAELHDRALEIAKAAAETFVTGDTLDQATTLGPVVNSRQFDHVSRLIQSGGNEGARLLTGGLGRPANLNRGYFIRPTVFGGVTPDMAIAREEIFGPVLSILPYESLDRAVEIANDTVYGLAAYVQTADLDVARDLASRLRAGDVYLNYPAGDISAPFGGYKQSGNGREYGEWGIDAFQEVKAVFGLHEAA